MTRADGSKASPEPVSSYPLGPPTGGDCAPVASVGSPSSPAPSPLPTPHSEPPCSVPPVDGNPQQGSVQGTCGMSPQQQHTSSQPPSTSAQPPLTPSQVKKKQYISQYIKLSSAILLFMNW